MSFPVELRLLCHQLSSTPTVQLPNLVPNLVRNVLQCQSPLRSGGQNGAKGEASETSVLVHKLKTQISTLLHGKSIEGRMVAVVLIKAAVAVGGWEVLRGVESWVRGLLSILGKQDPAASKRLCIVTLTGIYLMTYQYQSLLREVTIPTLPNYVSSCLNMISIKSSIRALDVPYLLTETVFESFRVLIPRHPTIFRPYMNQIKIAIRPYLSPTLCDRHFASLYSSQTARSVAVLLYQTAAKNTSGDEWGKGIRALVRDVHGTVDQVYRAVLEDWESTAGHISQSVDISQDTHGGAMFEEDLPAWNGIEAGIQRLEGMLQLLREHFMHRSANAVTVPLDLIIDLLTRLMSIIPPSNVEMVSENSGVRLHPGIEKNERQALWAGLGNIHKVSIEVYLILIDRLQHNFTSLAQRCLSQVAWIFSSHRLDEAFRRVVYQLMTTVLPLCGSSLDKSAVALLTPVIKACCDEFPIPENARLSRREDTGGKTSTKGASANADTFLDAKTASEDMPVNTSSEVLDAAKKLLPFLLSQLPQSYLQAYLRARIDQVAILAHQKEAMLASVLNPYVGQNGKALPSILPHLCRAFPKDAAVEALLRPRLPIVRQSQAVSNDQDLVEDFLQEVDDLMEDVIIDSKDNRAEQITTPRTRTEASNRAIEDNDKLVPTFRAAMASQDAWGGASVAIDAEPEAIVANEKFQAPMPLPGDPSTAKMVVTVPQMEGEEDSDESVHLTMELSDSEDEI